MPIIEINDMSDARLDPFRRMRDRDLAKEQNLFIVESQILLERLVETDYEPVSALCIPKTKDRMLAAFPSELPVYLIPEPELSPLIGSGYVSGSYALAKRKPYISMDEIPGLNDPGMLMVLPKLTTPRNVGAITRICAGLGATGMLIGEQCTDPFYRRAIRVSMGAAFKVPIAKSADIVAELKRLKDEFGYTIMGAILDESSVSLYDIHKLNKNPKTALLMGNEYDGLSDAEIALCDYTIQLPMQMDTDSLNVGTAAAVFMYELTRPQNSVLK